jgi:hypothetical protein
LDALEGAYDYSKHLDRPAQLKKIRQAFVKAVCGTNEVCSDVYLCFNKFKDIANGKRMQSALDMMQTSVTDNLVKTATPGKLGKWDTFVANAQAELSTIKAEAAAIRAELKTLSLSVEEVAAKTATAQKMANRRKFILHMVSVYKKVSFFIPVVYLFI